PPHPAPVARATGAAPSPAPGYPAYPQGYAPSPQGRPTYPQGYTPNPPAPGYGYPPVPAWPAQQPGQQPPAAWPNSAAPAAPAYPYGYQYPVAYSYQYPVAYGYPGYYYPPYYYPIPWRPRRAPTETLALVMSWIVTILGGVAVLLALALAALTVPALMTQSSDSLALEADLIAFVLGPLIGGAFAIYFGIRGILRRPSARFTLANPWWFAALAFVALVAGVTLWHLRSAPGSALATAPLLIASGVLPALAILALTSWRLRQPSTRRHVWMSLFYGLTLAPLLAIIFEVILSGVIGILFQRNLSQSLTQPTGSGDPTQVIIFLLTISAVAPLVEEGVKPLGAVLIMRRIRTPASAFLMGVAAGVGFDILETTGYIGMGEADWVNVAIGRVGAGLLHGVGAGMAALGWYYLINGKGVRLRWLRGFGGILYAVLQHAIFNGSNLLGFVPGPVGSWMRKPLYIGRLPLDGGTALFLVYYAIILGVLFYVTGRLARPSPSQEQRQTP
ncbi:MAG: PrsW family glutamic-type intramembrane protease, partial [Ktedonobacterales bacterium]